MCDVIDIFNRLEGVLEEKMGKDMKNKMETLVMEEAEPNVRTLSDLIIYTLLTNRRTRILIVENKMSNVFFVCQMFLALELCM